MSVLAMYILGAAMIVAGLSMLWYLFQTLRIMWGYSSLLAIAAVIFSPLIHIVFYFMPKDGLDKHERGIFKRYFLSIGVIAALGIVASIVIPAIEPQYQADAMTDNSDSGQPWDRDIRAENQEIAPTEIEVNSTDITDAEAVHYDAIFQAHPDADSIVDSAKFKNWWQSKPDVERRDYERVLNEGNSSEVIHMLTLFKIENGGQ